MRSEWSEVRLEDITSKIGDGLHGTPKYDDNGEYYFINGNNIGNGKIEINDKTKRVNYQEYLKHKKELTDRTLLVSINGTLGNVGLYQNENVCLGKSACYLNIIEDVDKNFVKYILTSSYFQDYIHVYATGTTIKNMGLKSMRDFIFKLPPLATQKKIAHILSTLDDKIELNRKINQTLEAMAQTLFKSWFVDFDPVHVKLTCKNDEELEVVARKLGISKEVLELFPSEFEESELGMIPKGWRISNIDNEFNVTMGQSPSGESYNETQNGIIFFQGRRDFGTYFPTKRVYTTEPKRLAKEDDILLSVRAPVGDINIAMEKCCIGRGLSALKHKSNSISYSYLILKNLRIYFDGFNTEGTVFGSVNQNSLKSLNVLKDEVIIKKFIEITEPMFVKIKHTSIEILSLEKTRDTLLPKLLSGELDVSEIEIEID